MALSINSAEDLRTVAQFLRAYNRATGGKYGDDGQKVRPLYLEDRARNVVNRDARIRKAMQVLETGFDISVLKAAELLENAGLLKG